MRSRLIGHTVEARQHPSTVELLYGGRVLCTMPRLRSEAEHRIDYRHVIASLVRKPGAIFSLVNAVILRDSPTERPEEVVNLFVHQASFAYSRFSYPDFEDVRDGTVEVFSDVAASQLVPVTIYRAEGGGVGIVPGEAVTGNYFPMLGIFFNDT